MHAGTQAYSQIGAVPRQPHTHTLGLPKDSPTLTHWGCPMTAPLKIYKKMVLGSIHSICCSKQGLHLILKLVRLCKDVLELREKELQLRSLLALVFKLGLQKPQRAFLSLKLFELNPF